MTRCSTLNERGKKKTSEEDENDKDDEDDDANERGRRIDFGQWLRTR